MIRRDDELRARFHGVREGDRARIPAFDALLARAEARAEPDQRPRGRAVVWVAAAASVVLAVGTAVLSSGDGDLLGGVADSDSSGVIATPSISRWTSPTASLLRTPGRDLLGPPSILSSILDGATRSVQHKGG